MGIYIRGPLFMETTKADDFGGARIQGLRPRGLGFGVWGSGLLRSLGSWLHEENDRFSHEWLIDQHIEEARIPCGGGSCRNSSLGGESNPVWFPISRKLVVS